MWWSFWVWWLWPQGPIQRIWWSIVEGNFVEQSSVWITSHGLLQPRCLIIISTRGRHCWFEEALWVRWLQPQALMQRTRFDETRRIINAPGSLSWLSSFKGGREEQLAWRHSALLSIKHIALQRCYAVPGNRGAVAFLLKQDFILPRHLTLIRRSGFFCSQKTTISEEAKFNVPTVDCLYIFAFKVVSRKSQIRAPLSNSWSRSWPILEEIEKTRNWIHVHR